MHIYTVVFLKGSQGIAAKIHPKHTLLGDDEGPGYECIVPAQTICYMADLRHSKPLTTFMSSCFVTYFSHQNLYVLLHVYLCVHHTCCFVWRMGHTTGQTLNVSGPYKGWLWGRTISPVSEVSGPNNVWDE